MTFPRVLAVLALAACHHAGDIPAPAPDAYDVPFDVLANAIYVSARVNERGPFLFALDTGSCCSVFATELLDELAMTPQGETRGMGAGSSANQMGVIRGKIEFTFDVGLKLATDDANSVAMAPLWPLIGRKFHGVIGYDVLKDYVVRLDYDRGVATFESPGTHRAGGGTRFPATLAMKYDPQIAGTLVVPGLPSIATRFTIDTGAGGTIVTPPLVAEHHLFEHVVERIPMPSHGVGGGTSDDVVGRIDAITLGPYTLARPLVALSRDTSGSLTMSDLGVNLGGNLLRRFAVTIDYPGRTVTLEPGAHVADPFAADASGLLLEARGSDFRTFVVTAIVPGSPATEAHLEAGDVIATIDGKPATGYVLYEVMDLLKRTGHRVVLTVVRGDRTIRFELMLRALA